jgi:chromosome segregation ATPase
LQEENIALSEDLAVMVKENQLVSSQLGDATQRATEARADATASHSATEVLKQSLKAKELEFEDLRVAYEGLATESRQTESHAAQLKRQLGGHGVELEGARAEIACLQEASRSAQMQLQQYVVDVQALERNNDSIVRELQAAKADADDIARDRNRVLEQLQVAQVISRLQIHLMTYLVPCQS